MKIQQERRGPPRWMDDDETSVKDISSIPFREDTQEFHFVPFTFFLKYTYTYIYVFILFLFVFPGHQSQHQIQNGHHVVCDRFLQSIVSLSFYLPLYVSFFNRKGINK